METRPEPASSTVANPGPLRKSPLTIEPRFRLRQGRRFEFGPGKADLLERIARTGSIAEAARELGMSYMRAWTLVQSLNDSLREAAVVTARGGRQRGGATVTATGQKLLALYRGLERQSVNAAKPVRARIERLLQP